MLPTDIVEWLEGNQHPGYARFLSEHQENVQEALIGLGISPSTDIWEFYLKFGPFTASGWYELNRADDIEKWTNYAHTELGVPENFIALTSIEGQGITLYQRSTGKVFDVEFGQFEMLASGELAPIAMSFTDFLRWCKAKSEEDA